MPSWEETKRAGQMAFILAGNMFQDIHSSIGNAYQQILITGHLHSLSGNNMTQEIVQGTYDRIEHESPLLPGREQNAPEPDTSDPRTDIEPER